MFDKNKSISEIWLHIILKRNVNIIYLIVTYLATFYLIYLKFHDQSMNTKDLFLYILLFVILVIREIEHFGMRKILEKGC